MRLSVRARGRGGDYQEGRAVEDARAQIEEYQGRQEAGGTTG